MRQELLAPAGSLETFYAVIAAGANAVYLGGPKFGARAYAKNFTTEECVQAIKYAHLKGVKVYMTVNTLVKNTEFEECIKSVRPYYEAGLDGVIVQDLGVLKALGEAYPGMELHASTQMSVSNCWGAKLLKKFGVSRVVPSRELSLTEIQRIREEADIEVETFIHGALCYSFSGQCLMSSLIGGRSGNRGRCAQPCRLPYEVYNDKHQKVSPAGTILSLKDLAMLPKLPDLAKLPVDSLKIEGRMKQSEYAYRVVSLYRKYLNQCEEATDISELSKKYHVSAEDTRALLNSGNREGFTTGYYYQRNDKNMITKDSSAHSSAESITLPKELLSPQQEAINGKVLAYVGQPIELMITYKDKEYRYVGPLGEEANNKPTTAEQISKQMNKTGNSLFVFQNLEVLCGENVFFPVSVLNEFRRSALDMLLEDILKDDSRNRTTEWSMQDLDLAKKESGSMYLALSGNLRSHMKAIADYEDIKRVYVELDSYDLLQETEKLLFDLKELENQGKEGYLAFPYVFRTEYEKQLEPVFSQLATACCGFVARSLDSLGYLLEKRTDEKAFAIVADESLYTYSDFTNQCYLALGCETTTLPYELNKKELEHKDNRASEEVIYGRLPVMITANCVRKTCGVCKNHPGADKEYYYLKDRKGAFFPVEINCKNCGNIIYNSVPLYLMESDCKCLNAKGYRIHITNESKEEFANVMKLYQTFIGNQKQMTTPLKDYTYGHYKRGVE